MMQRLIERMLRGDAAEGVDREVFRLCLLPGDGSEAASGVLAAESG